MHLKKIEMRERQELEPLLVENLSILEEGMKVAAHQLSTPSGPLDILAVDEDGALALIELKNEIDDREAVLLQALRYYDWVAENRAWIANIYKHVHIDPQKEPRLILVAPNFSTPLKRLAKYLAIEAELFRYQGVQLPSGEKSLVISQDFYDERPDTPKIASIPQSAQRMKDSSVKKIYTDCLEDLKTRHIDLQPRASNTVSGFFGGRRILRIYVKNRFFVVRLQHADGSMTGRIRISSATEWQQFIQDYLGPRIAEMEEE